MQSDNSPEDAAKRDPQEHKPTDPEPESFQKILKATEKCDEESVKAWREDIDTLLVFAGIFSGVIAAFLIESYHTLEEDPADKTVLLLEQLVLFQRNASLALTADPIPPFKPDASMVRINCFWFLSLTFSITSALYGLLCKQWIREFARDTPTSTAAESLALRQLRRDGFEKWKVPAFISALPILLEVAVILFFVGILDLLWGLHRTPFIATMTVVAVSAVVYFTTTLLPTVMIPGNLKTDIEHGRFERLSYQFICPYKTPQAWAVYRLACIILSPLSRFWDSAEEFQGKHEKAAPALRCHNESPASDWSSLDLRVVRQYDQKVKDSEKEPLQDPIPPFQPDASIIRINCFWFLSLIISLTSAVFSLLCREWVQEFERDTPTSTPLEALELRQLRRDSFEKWKVPAFLAALPILVELALILFFMGILDLLWTLHRIPFIVSLVAIGLGTGLYIITTLLPILMIPKNLETDIEFGHFGQLSYQFICPYKSSQAWAVYRFTCNILYPLSKLWYSTEKLEKEYGKAAPALRYHIESPASDWSSLDLRVVRQYDQKVKGSKKEPLQVYQLRAFEWAVRKFRSSPLMIPHLQKVLGTIPYSSVAMSAVLGRWNTLSHEVSDKDVDAVFRGPRYPISRTSGSPDTSTPIEAGICQSRKIKALFDQQFKRNPSNETSLIIVTQPDRQ